MHDESGRPREPGNDDPARKKWIQPHKVDGELVLGVADLGEVGPEPGKLLGLDDDLVGLWFFFGFFFGILGLS